MEDRRKLDAIFNSNPGYRSSRGKLAATHSGPFFHNDHKKTERLLWSIVGLAGVFGGCLGAILYILVM